MKGKDTLIDHSLVAGARRSGLESLLSNWLFVLLVDLLIALSAYSCAWLIRIFLALPYTAALLPQERWTAVSHPWLVLLASQILILYFLGLYDDLRSLRSRQVVTFTLMCCFVQMLTISSVFFFLEQIFPRTVIVLFDVMNFLGLVSWRTVLRSRLTRLTRRTLVVGKEAQVLQEIIADIEQSPWMGLRVVGLLTKENHETTLMQGYPLLGTLDEADRVVQEYGIEEIIFASPPSWKDDVLSQLCVLQEKTNLKLTILPSLYDMVIGKLHQVNIHDTPLIEVKNQPNEPFERLVKRLFDVLASSLGLVLGSPLLLLVSVVMKVVSPGPVFYFQDRIGLLGRSFKLVKFRTMIPDAEADTGAVYAEENDPRVTGLGRILRRTRLDELPQLINVLLGQMSFVGPRPERPAFVAGFEKTVPGYTERHKVKPGITGLAQVRGFYDTRAETKLKYDIAYIYNFSFSLDLLILLETIKTVLIRRGS